VKNAKIRIMFVLIAAVFLTSFLFVDFAHDLTPSANANSDRSVTLYPIGSSKGQYSQFSEIPNQNVIFADEFGEGDFSAYSGSAHDGASSTVTVQSTTVYSGTYAAKISAANNGGYAYFYKTISTNDTQLNLRFYVDFITLPETTSGNSCPLLYISSTYGGGQYGTRIDLYYNGTKDIFRFYDSYGGNYYPGTTALQTGTWYCVELQAEQFGTNARLYLNGNQEIQGHNDHGYAFNAFYFGPAMKGGGTNTNHAGQPETMIIADVVCSGSSIGQENRPNLVSGSSSTTALQISAYTSQTNPATSEQETEPLQGAQVSGVGCLGPITSVTAYMVGEASATSNCAAETLLVDTSTNANAYAGAMGAQSITGGSGDLLGSGGASSTSGFSVYSDTYSVDPATGNAWTWAEINATQAGAKATSLGAGNAIQFSEFYVTVSYSAQVLITVTSSTTGSGYIAVDGTSYTTPHTFTWTIGNSHALAANNPANAISGQSQYIFNSWSSTSIGTPQTSASYNYSVPSFSETVTASFTKQFYLTVIGGNNPTGNGWYTSGTTASFSVSTSVETSATTMEVLSGWTGTGTGAYTGPSASNSVIMNNPITETATWNKETIGVIGYSDATYKSGYTSNMVNLGAPDVYLIPLVTPSNMTVTNLAWYSYGSSGLYGVVIYNNRGNVPYQLLYDKNGFSFSKSAWNQATISYNLVGGTKYWFGIITSAATWAAGTDQSTTGTLRYSASYPNPSATYSGSGFFFSATMSLYVNYTATSPNFPPIFSTVAYNAIIANHTTDFSIPISDWTNIEGYMFSSNSTGTMRNSTFTSISPSFSATANSVVVMPKAGNSIAVQWFALGADGSWGSSPTYTFTSYPTPSGLYIIGNQIFEPNGTVITLKGMDSTYLMLNDGEYGSWMYPNGSISWLTSSLDKTGVSDFLTFLQASNCNFIRLPLTVSFWLDNTDNYQSTIEYLITQAANRGIWIDIVFYNNNATDSEPVGVLPWNDVGNNVLNSSADFVNLWANVATTLKNYPTALFELWNEPQGSSADETTWFTVAQQCINTIRTSGALQPILLQWDTQLSYDFNPNGGGVRCGMSWVFTYPLSDPVGNLIYCAHIYSGANNGFYNSNGYTMVSDYSDIQYALTQEQVFAVAAIHPVFIGEIGDNILDTGTTTGVVYVNGVADNNEQDVFFNNTLTILDQTQGVIGYAGWAAPPWRTGVGEYYGFVVGGAANYELDNSGLIFIAHTGGMSYSEYT